MGRAAGLVKVQTYTDIRVKIRAGRGQTYTDAFGRDTYLPNRRKTRYSSGPLLDVRFWCVCILEKGITWLSL